jgi:hypothetical protein
MNTQSTEPANRTFVRAAAQTYQVALRLNRGERVFDES